MQNETKKELHTQMWKIENPKDFTPHDREVLEKAAAIIRAGGLVAFPTETVYGLGANALDEAAAKKIYAAKGRPSDNPLIAHVSCLEEIAPLVSNMPENGKKLAKAYWPGPMTMVFPKSAIVPYGTTGGLDTVAIRMPSDPIAAELIRLSGVPIAAPSANTSGRPSPTRADHEQEALWRARRSLIWIIVRSHARWTLMLRSATHLDLADTMHVSSYRSIRSSKYHVIYQKKGKGCRDNCSKGCRGGKGC